MSRHVLLAGAIAAAICAPALAAGDSTAAPDFFGRWGRNAFNFEPLPAGPQPLTNLSRRPDGTGNPAQLVGDWRNPILKPEAAAAVKEKGERAIAGLGYPDPSNQCRPYAPPFTFAMQLSFQMLPTEDGLTIVYNQNHDVRRVRMNAKHPANAVPSHMGDSVGHWEGDTLVIDTVGIKTGPYTMVDRWGTPHSEALHVVERYRLIDGKAAKEAQERFEKADGRVGGEQGASVIDPDSGLKGLQLEVTVEDPNVFTAPWSAYVTYRRMGTPWVEAVCAENPVEHYKDEWIGLPIADRTDF